MGYPTPQDQNGSDQGSPGKDIIEWAVTDVFADDVERNQGFKFIRMFRNAAARAVRVANSLLVRLESLSTY
jgi:hypothetical protein